MKRGDLLRHLRKHGCHLKREGRSHSLWTNPTTGAVEAVHEALLILYKCIDLAAVENQERLHGGVADALVAVHERVVSNQRYRSTPPNVALGWAMGTRGRPNRA